MNHAGERRRRGEEPVSAETILVVEDNPVSRKAIRLTLQTAGYRVLEAADGRMALDLAAREDVDLILQDLLLPDIDGFDLVAQLRALSRGRQIAIVAFSGLLSKLERARITTAGFDDSIAKPIEPSRLIPLVRTFLPLRAAEGQLRGRLLLVDDNEVLRKLARLHLTGLGFEVETAADGAEALETVHRRPPDIVVSDVLMPRLDGFGLCRALRRDPRFAAVPIVLVSSSYVEAEDARLARNVGANALVLRAPDLKELVAAVRAVQRGELRPDPVAAPESTTAEHAERLLRQVERQVAMNASLAQRCALLDAELSMLSGIAEVLGRTLDVEPVVGEVLGRCLEASGLSLGAIYLLAPDGTPRLAADIGYDDTAREGLETFFGQTGLLQRVVESGRLLLVPSGNVDDELARTVLAPVNATSALVVPIASAGETLGVLVLMSSRYRELADEDWVPFAQTTAVQIGQAIRISRLFTRATAAEARYRSVFEHAAEGIFRSTPAGRFLLVNPAMARIFGYASPTEMIVTVSDIGRQLYVEPEVRAELLRLLEARGAVSNFECRMSRKDGAVIWALVSAHVVRDERGGVLYHDGVLTDTTERKRMEETLRQTEKLATMGELLAGVAHELNNPLTVVRGRAALLQQKLQGGPLGPQVEKLAQAAERCARIVRNFLALARQHPPEREHVSLNQVVREAVELLAYPLRVDNVEVMLELADDLPTLWADPHQLHQVIVNLVTNAHHAMGDTPPPRRLIFISRYESEQGRALLRVADTGPGIPPELQGRIFEPFFTTKPLGQGTGLGLSICRGIIEGHGGSVRMESQPGRGAIFVIELPVQAPPTGVPEGRAAETTAPIPGKLILVVDDEPEVAAVLADMLSADGHQVETAENGAVALDKLRGRAYDLILCDCRMPELDGPGLHQELQRRDPRLCRRFVFLTGDALSPGITELLEQTGAATLSKPFAFDEVRRVVRSALRAG